MSWKEVNTANENEPCDGTITVTSTSDFPPDETSIPCTIKFHYVDWKAKFETSYSTADDTFDDEFNLLSMNDTMREEEGGGPHLTVGGIDNRGYQTLVGCAPRKFSLYAKRCVEGEGETRLSNREKKELGIKRAPRYLYMNEDHDEDPEDEDGDSGEEENEDEDMDEG